MDLDSFLRTEPVQEFWQDFQPALMWISLPLTVFALWLFISAVRKYEKRKKRIQKELHSPGVNLFFSIPTKKEIDSNEYLASFSPIVTSTIIRLYDHIGDLDGGTAFCDELISLHLRDPKKYGVQDQARDPYFVIKQAFLEDKKAGTKGHATQALIQSDYFPW